MPCNECVCRRPVGRRSARVAPAEPQHQAAGRYHPKPAGGEFAVEAARPAQVQIVVELVDPGPQGKGAGRSVLLQIAAHLTCVRVHEHGQRVSGADPRHPAQQHPCRRPLLRWGPNRADLALGVGLAGRVHLLRHRQFAGARGDPQLIGVQDLLGLVRTRVQQPRRGRDEQERGDEQARVEVCETRPAGVEASYVSEPTRTSRVVQQAARRSPRGPRRGPCRGRRALRRSPETKAPS